MLEIRNLHAYYGEIEALHGIDLSVDANEIVCIIGANGAGKTTLLNSITGSVRCTGEIRFQGESIMGKSPVMISKKGVMHVPEGRHVFPGLTVSQNLEMGTVCWHGFFGRESFMRDIEMVYQLFPRLKERANQHAWSLSGGEQQMLAIGRALMGRPSLLLLDEPSMGLAPLVIDELFEKIREINTNGLPILLIEQNARMALDVSAKAYILERGKISFSGMSQDLQKDARVMDAYLGGLGNSRARQQ